MTATEAGTVIGSGSKTPSSWTPERVQMLRDIWPKGYSASQTAAMIGGITRCAVIGKVHRLGLPTRTRDQAGGLFVDPAVAAERAKKARERDSHRKSVRRANARGAAVPEFSASPQSEIPAAPAYEGSLRLQLADVLTGQCLFPEGKEPPFEFCGNPVAGGTSWCHHHQNVVYQPPERRRTTSYLGNRLGRKVSNYVGSHEA